MNNTGYNPFENMAFTYECCFLCGTYLDDTSETEEHVFPKWLQKRYNLWNKTITLLNNTTIPYRSLYIPCCKQCNTKYLQSIETTICEKSKLGFETFKKIDEIIIYRWICKIFYGLLFKELSLVYDRKNPSLGKIMTEEDLRQFEMLHLFMQSVRLPMSFLGYVPWSIFIFEIQTKNIDKDRRFNYIDVFSKLVSIRFDDIGIIACLEDHEVQKQFVNSLNEYKKLFNIKLHPVQLDEIFAKIIYKQMLFNRSPLYSIIWPDVKEDEINNIYISSDIDYCSTDVSLWQHENLAFGT